MAATKNKPRRRTLTWQLGDTVTVGGIRYAIRNIHAETVELEALNTSTCGMWWTTTLTRLGRKEP
jgi:hypothetical protein